MYAPPHLYTFKPFRRPEISKTILKPETVNPKAEAL